MTTNGTEKRPLPPGWIWTTIKEVAEVNYGKGLPKNKRDEEGEIPVYGSNGITGYHSEPLIDGPCLIIGRKGAAGVVHYSPTACWPIDTAYYAHFRNDVFLKYAYYVFKTLELESLDRSTAIPSLSRDDLYIQTFPLAPFSEQERIVAEIEKQFTRLDQAVASLRRLQEQLARYKASLLKAACEGRLLPQDPHDEPARQLLQRILAERRARWQAADPGKKYKEPIEVNSLDLPNLPQGWIWSNMDSLIIDGPQNGLYLPKSKYGEGTPILRIDDYQNGESRSSNQLRKVAASQQEIQKYSLRKYDMVINRVNSPSHLGKCLVIGDKNLPSLFESNMMRMAFAKNVNPHFVEFYLQSADGRMRLISNAKWAVNQASINQGDVRITPVPLPPLAEQKRIVAEVERRLSVVATAEAAVAANLTRSGRLRQAILHQAFNGRLV